MEISVGYKEEIPVIQCKGKLDAAGANIFAEKCQSIDDKAIYWILDLSDLDYLSSIGIRAILKIEKALKSKSGGLIVILKNSFVKSTLNAVGILDFITLVENVDEGISVVKDRKRSDGAEIQNKIGSREFTSRILFKDECSMDVWGSENRVSPGDIAPKDLQSVSLSDLAFSYGIGGFGYNIEHAVESAGYFCSGVKFAALLPFSDNSEADFIFSENPADTHIYIHSAIGFYGKPSLLVMESSKIKISLKHIIENLSALTLKTSGKNFAGMLILGKYIMNNETKRCLVLFSSIEKNPETEKTLLGSSNIQTQNSSSSIYFNGINVITTYDGELDFNILPEENIKRMINLDNAETITALDPELEIEFEAAWIYISGRINIGEEKLVKVELEEPCEFKEEWTTIIRKIYSDCSKVILKPLHGGYMSKTFSAVSYDKQNRKQLPTVVKISSLELAEREEYASRNYVEKFILNNSTSIMGSAQCGDWKGIRYNFLGITGADTKLEWMRNIYTKKTDEEIITLLDNIYTNILKPWYGQPKWEPVFLYREHTPLSIFVNLFEDAKRDLGVDPDAKTIFCKELGIELPNPVYFLKYEYPKRINDSVMWYTSITHGDLNLQNILVDEKNNIYIIDFSETHTRNVVSDFARIEPVVLTEFNQIESDEELRQMLEFAAGLLSINYIDEVPPFIYSGNNPLVHRAYKVICRLRKYANIATLFERSIVPYLFPLFEWTASILSYVSLQGRYKKFALYSSAMMVRKILEADKK